MEIRTLEESSDGGQWDDYVRAHPDGTLFHETAWTRSVKEAYRHPALPLAAYSNGKIAGVLPLFHVKSFLFGSRFVSTAFGVYGGILADDPLIAEGLASAARDLARDRGAKYVELKSRKKVLEDVPVKDLYFTFRIPTVPGDVDKTLAGLNKKMRQDLRRAEHKGWEFSGDVPLPVFYDRYLHTLRFHGTPPFPLRWFQALRRNLGDRCIMLGVRQNGEWTGASMLFRDRDVLMPFYTGVPRRFMKLRTTVALHMKMLRIACESDCKFLDLGRSKIGTGAFDAKTHWGITPEPLAYQYLLREGEEVPNLSPTNPKLQPLIAMWRKLPLQATRMLGPVLNASLA